eukprot:SM000034S12664  [mRNA]  locus=s34:9623:10288:- [translate_table: standard]
MKAHRAPSSRLSSPQRHVRIRLAFTAAPGISSRLAPRKYTPGAYGCQKLGGSTTGGTCLGQ